MEYFWNSFNHYLKFKSTLAKTKEWMTDWASIWEMTDDSLIFNIEFHTKVFYQEPLCQKNHYSQ